MGNARRALAALVTAGLAAIVVAGLVTAEPHHPDRVRALASRLRCPVCESESVADSPAPISADIRRDIAAQVRAGRSDDEIIRSYTDRYGEEILLDPPVGGRTWALWALPPLGLLVGLVAVVARRRRTPVPELTPEERVLLAAERRRAEAEGGDDRNGDL